MDPKSRNARIVATLIAFGLLVTALAFLFFGPTAVAQGRRLAQIGEYQRIWGPRLAAEPRFKSIRLGASTTNSGGILIVQGAVATEADLAALQQFIDLSKPPSQVRYFVALSKQ